MDLDLARRLYMAANGLRARLQHSITGAFLASVKTFVVSAALEHLPGLRQFPFYKPSHITLNCAPRVVILTQHGICID